MQNLYYIYDPVGNITHNRDDAQQSIYFKNKRVEPCHDYTYDAIYRLIDATGRAHLGQVGGAPSPYDYNDLTRVNVQHPGDGNAMSAYLERYVYDAIGNLLELRHRGSDPAYPGWTRTYTYNETSQLEPGKKNNRLTSTTINTNIQNYSTAGDGYDNHGNMLHMPHLQVMQWDFEDQLQMTQRQAVNDADVYSIQHHGERTWYVYDATGQRVRKVTELATGQVKDERIYLGGFEIYRKSGANPIMRETLHIMDEKQRIALVETRTQGNESGVPQQIMRYQFSNHLGSASLELDNRAQILSYEEYTPYGSTTYQAVRSQTETPKRYRYTGKERDNESGFYHHQFRYYAPWLCRWISCDPIGIDDHINLYVYVHNNPVNTTDPLGLRSWRKVAVIAAAVTVGVVVTVATAGAAAPIAAAAVASIGLTGTAATVATGVAVGAVAGAVGGAAAGAAGETTRQVTHGEELSGCRILSEAGSGAAIGGAVGVAIPLAAAAIPAAGGAVASTTAGAAVVGASRTIGSRVAATAVGRGVATAGRAVASAGQRASSSTAGRAVTAIPRAASSGLRRVHSASQGAGERIAAGLPGRVGENARYIQAGERISRRLAEGPIGRRRVAAAAEVDVPGYTGNPTPRALSGHHATPGHSPVPTDETRSLTSYRVGQVETSGSPRMADWQLIANPGQGHAGSRAVDAEIKLLQEIQQGLPSNARGSIHVGATKETCPSCMTGMFEFQANNPGIELVLHSPSTPAPMIP